MKASYLVVLAACGSGSSGGNAASRVGPALSAAVDTAQKPREPGSCASLDTPELPAGSLGDWKLAGHTLSHPGPPRDVAIGVIADAGGASPTTLAALGRLRARLDAEHVDVVISLGGMGATQADLEASLAALATGATWPLVSLPGDLEPVAAHDAAVTALRTKGAPVVDARRARWVEFPGVVIGTLPGAGSVDRLVAGADGCGWRPADLDALAAGLADKPGLRVLASAEAPRGFVHGDATGDLALGVKTRKAVDVVLHGAAEIASAPASGGRDGAATALTPGVADATPRLPGPQRSPSAGVLLVHDGHWSWRPLVDAR